MEHFPAAAGYDGPTYLPVLAPGIPLLARETTLRELVTDAGDPLPTSRVPVRAWWWCGIEGLVWCGMN
jgi:hypothetical protein